MFNFKKKKPVQTQETPETPEEKTLAEISEHRKGGESIRRQLSGIDVFSSSIPADKLKTYNAAITQLCEILDDEMPSGVDTASIDSDISKMTELLRNSLRRGNESTSDQILKAIGEGVKRSRISIYASNESSAEQVLDKRKRYVRNLRAICEFQDCVDGIYEADKRTQGEIKKLEEKLKATGEKARQLEKDNPDLAQQKIAARQTGKTTPLIIEYTDAVESYTRTKNTLDKARIIRDQELARAHKLENICESINVIIFGTKELLGDSVMESYENILDDYKKMQAEAKVEKTRLDEMTDRFDAIFDAGMEDAVKDFIRADREYQKIRAAEERRQAQKEAAEKLQKAMEEKARQVEQQKQEEEELQEAQEQEEHQETLITNEE